MIRNETEIATIVEYLFPKGDRKRSNYSKYIGNTDRGRELYNVIGCKGCHNIQEKPSGIKGDFIVSTYITSTMGVSHKLKVKA